MEIKSLTTFVHVAELGSFSRAGERLGYSQPSVSVQIRQLEEELGARLFDRIGHAVRLTDKGREILPYAQKICLICRQMSQGDPADAGQETLIRLATSDSLSSRMLLDKFPRIHRLHPGIRLELTTAGTGELFRLLEHNEVDLVCTLDSHIYNTNFCIASEEKVGVHFVVPSESSLARKAYLSWEDLMSQKFLLTEKGMSYRRLLDEWLAKASLEVRPVLEAGQADLLCALVEQGQGISFLPDFATEDAVRRGTVKRLDAENFQPDLWVQLLYHREKWISPAIQAVIGVLTGKHFAGE